jgi:hypothetical protein
VKEKFGHTVDGPTAKEIALLTRANGAGDANTDTDADIYLWSRAKQLKRILIESDSKSQSDSKVLDQQAADVILHTYFSC